MKYLLIAALILRGVCCAQSTTVSTTGVIDSDSLTWAGGTYQISFVPNPNQGNVGMYTWTGGNLQANLLFQGTLNGSGAFSVSLPSNSAITPAGSQWKYSICPNATSGCFSINFPANGATLDLTTTLNQSAIGPRFVANPTAYGYGTIEVSPVPLPGAFFYNTTSGSCQQWNGSAWGDCGGGGGTCPENTCVLNSPTASQSIVQPTGTAFELQSPTTVITTPTSASLIEINDDVDNGNVWSANGSITLTAGQSGTGTINLKSENPIALDNGSGAAQKITNLATATNPSDAVPLSQLSGLSGTYAPLTNPTGGQNGYAYPTAYPSLAATSSPLATTFLQAINNAANQVVNVVVNGDSGNRCSHPICGGAGNGPTQSINREPEVFRVLLQGQNGINSHGGGMLPIVYGMQNSPATPDPSAWAIAGTYDTTTVALGPFASAQGSLVHLATTAVATYNDVRNIKYSGGNVYFATTSSSGTITINVDGTNIATANATTFTTSGAVNAGFTARMLTLPSFAASGTHTVTFTASGDCYLFAFESTFGTTGVSVHNVAIGGATSTSLGGSATTQNAFYDLIPGGIQGEYVQFLPNDAGSGLSTSTFGTNLTNLVNHYQALASKPTVEIVVWPADVVSATDSFAPYVTVMQGLCTSLNIQCLNLQGRGTTVGGTAKGWGTSFPGCPNELWDCTSAAWPTGNAGVHVNDKGGLDEGSQLYASFMNPTSSTNTNCQLNSTCTVAALTATSETINNTAASGLTINSSNSAGSGLTLQGSAAGVHTWIELAASTAGAFVPGEFLLGDTTPTVGIYSWGQSVTASGSGFIETPSLIVDCWSSGASITANGCDTGMSRDAAAAIDFGNGTQGSKSGTLNLTNVNATGVITGGSSSNTASSSITVNSLSNAPLNLIDVATGTTSGGAYPMEGMAYTNLAVGAMAFKYLGSSGSGATADAASLFGYVRGATTTQSAAWFGLLGSTGTQSSQLGIQSCGNGSVYIASSFGNTCPVSGTAASLNTPQIVASGGTPTMTPGAAAGTSPTCTAVTGANMAGVLTCTTGTATTTGTLATITFNGTLGTAPQGCSLMPRNAITAGTFAYTTAPSTTSWTIGIGTIPLAASTLFSWSYNCI